MGTSMSFIPWSTGSVCSFSYMYYYCIELFFWTVCSDLTRNPLIVPLKVLKGHEVVGGIGIFSIAFHPRQPWIFTAGADGIINLFQDI